ncbi:hypothetical protein IMZ48_47980, partial [Candidatus Bathyarchaeota archaeon]|nr:hypothetical protein [Candidatus Bathyarchaeota archaeon]
HQRDHDQRDRGPQQGNPDPRPRQHPGFHPLRSHDAGLAPRPPPSPSSPTPAPRHSAKVMNPSSDRTRAAPSTPQQQQQQQQPQTAQYQQHAPPQPPHGQSFAAMNGMNGGPVPAGMVGMPTPAGHQSELNYIYTLVEELSRQLADNRRQTEDIVSGIGRVRNRARNQALGNEELINAASDEINGACLHQVLRAAYRLCG